MDPSQIVDMIFSLDRNIRYVGVVGPDPDYEIITIPIAGQAHHVDTEFYEKYISLPLPEAIINHMKSWHR